jgi:hypothetical protein
MADTAISALPAASALSDADILTILQGGSNKRITARLLARYIGDALHNESFAAAQSVPASATTYLTGSPITIPTGERVAVGTWVRWNYHLAKTAAGTLANSILIKWGTLGTTADATLLTLALPAGTAVADEAEVEVVVGFRSIGAGTAAVLTGRARLLHNLAATGWATIPDVVTAVAVSAGFNSDVDLSKIGLAMTMAASYVVTASLMRVEGKNA